MPTKILFIILGLSISFLGFSQKTLIPKEKKGKWGYVKEGTEKFAIKAKYENAMPFGQVLNADKALVKQKGKWGIIDAKGKFVIEPKYDTVFESKRKSGSYKIARIEKTKYFLDKNGKEVSDAFTDFSDIGDSWVLVSKEQKFGLLSKNEDVYRELIPMRYNMVGMVGKNIFYLKGVNTVSFYNAETQKQSENYEGHRTLNLDKKHSLVVVIRDKKQGIINDDFELILPIEYTSIRLDKNKKEGITYLTIRKENLNGVVDTLGKAILPTEFKEVKFEKGFFVAKKDSLWGTYEKTGKGVLPHQYSSIHIWDKEQVFQVKIRGKEGIIDKAGQVILPLEYSKIQILHQSDSVTYFKTTQDKKMHAWKLHNKVVTKLFKQDYDNIAYIKQHFVVSLANPRGSEKDLKKGLVDDKGKVIVSIQYQDFHFFKKDLFLAESKGKKGLIDITGKTILPLEYDVLLSESPVDVYLEKGNQAFIWNVEEKKSKPTAKRKVQEEHIKKPKTRKTRKQH